MSPPTLPDHLNKKQSEIEDKLQWYKDNGASKLKEQIEELKKKKALEDASNVEQARNDKLRDEEEKDDAPQRDYGRRGGRGNRGRGRGGY